jgi:hypothetical protein
MREQSPNACSEKLSASPLLGRHSNADERMSGMETRPEKRLFIVSGVLREHDRLL